LSDEPDTEADTDADSDEQIEVFAQGGCDCDSGGQPAGWLVLGLLPLALRRRRRS
jgi:MYXO-CTERM domain-containing protein